MEILGSHIKIYTVCTLVNIGQYAELFDTRRVAMMK